MNKNEIKELIQGSIYSIEKSIDKFIKRNSTWRSLENNIDYRYVIGIKNFIWFSVGHPVQRFVGGFSVSHRLQLSADLTNATIWTDIEFLNNDE